MINEILCFCDFVNEACPLVEGTARFGNVMRCIVPVIIILFILILFGYLAYDKIRGKT